MRFHHIIFAGVAASMLSPISQAVVWSNELTDANMIAFGQDVRFAGTGRLSIGGSFGTGSFLGISRTGEAWGISAKHVVDTGDTGSFFLPGLGTYSISNATGFAGKDVSVFKINGWNQNLPSRRLYTSGVYTVGTRFYSAGFGGNRPESGNTYDFDNNRRGFQTILDQYLPVNNLWPEAQPFLIDRFDAPGDPNHQPFEGFGAPGDSGSFLLDDQNQIWGVLSGGDFEKYGAENWYASITPTLANQIYTVTNIDPVPEPATVIALMAGVGALARRRRQRNV